MLKSILIAASMLVAGQAALADQATESYESTAAEAHTYAAYSTLNLGGIWRDNAGNIQRIGNRTGNVSTVFVNSDINSELFYYDNGRVHGFWSGGVEGQVLHGGTLIQWNNGFAWYKD